MKYIYIQFTGDLALRNCLLTDNLVAKIADFGLSRHLGNYQVYKKKTNCPLPYKHIAIEGLKEFIFSKQSDIWSLGIVFFEMFSSGVPILYPGIKQEDFLQKLESGYRMPKPSTFTPDAMYVSFKQN